MEQLKAAMVGVGGFGAHRRATMRESGLFDIVACYDINEETLKKAADEEDARACASYDEMLAVPGVEVVVVSTGAKFHAEQTIKALRAGKHVFVEKPLASTEEEVRAIISTMKQTGLVVGVGHAYEPGNALTVLAKHYVETGKLGTVTAVEANSSHSGALAAPPDDWRFDPEKNPGGMLFQCGVHTIHKMRYIFGEIREVSAFMRYDVQPKTRTPDATITLLRFDSGLLATLNCYHVTAYNHAFRIFGTRGNLYMQTINGNAEFQERKAGDPEVPRPVKADVPTDGDGCGELRSFAEAIRAGGGIPYPSVYDGAKAVAVCFAAVESGRTGCKVELENLGWPE